jgi:hypothetical protein
MVTNVNGVANGSTYADSKEGKVKENVEEEEEKEKEEERVPSRGKNGINLQIKNKQRKQALRPADEGSVTFRTVSSILKVFAVLRVQNVPLLSRFSCHRVWRAGYGSRAAARSPASWPLSCAAAANSTWYLLLHPPSSFERSRSLP